jgi:DNA-binding transcriptional LysR family regulator
MNSPRVFHPTLRQLRAFAAVYQLRKVSAAAQQLSVTQSAVSVLLRQMEDGLGARLFDRTTRSLQPTRAADEAIVVAERILRDLDSLGTGLRELTTLRRGRVSVAVTPTLGEIALPAPLRRFAREHPDIHVAVDDCAPDQFVARVVSGRVDFGIGAPEQSAIVERLNTEITAALADPAIVATMRAQGVEPDPGTAAAFGAYIHSETAKWSGVIRKANIKLD